MKLLIGRNVGTLMVVQALYKKSIAGVFGIMNMV